MTSIENRYQRAEQFLKWNLEPKLKNITLEPHWFDGHRFWFKRDLQEGYEFILVDSENLSQNPVFDHHRLALSFTELLGQPFISQQLPIETFEYCAENQLRILIDPKIAQGKRVLLNLENYTCTLETKTLPGTIDDDLPSVISPDGEREVICRGFNLFLREVATGVEKALTEDGEAHYGYGNYSEHFSFGCLDNSPLPPAVLWSPDGRYLAVQRVDQRQVLDMSVMQSVPQEGSFRPICHHYKMALPGDTHVPLASLCVIDLLSGDRVYSDRPPMPASIYGFVENHALEWETDNRLFLVERTRDGQTIRFVEIDPRSGTSRVLIEEQGRGFIGPEIYPVYGQTLFEVLPEINELIWYSRRSGWGHLYRYDLSTGELKNPITLGDYVVTKIHYINAVENCVFFTACGREPDCNPYYEHLYKVNMDGTGLQLLTPEVSHHDIVPSNTEVYKTGIALGFSSDMQAISPNGKSFVDTISRIDQPSRSVLRSCVDGAELMTLAQCDPSSIPAMPMPQSFTVKATDGITDLWGVMYRPNDMDEREQYPVVLNIYGTPQCCITQRKFAEVSLTVDMGSYQAFAELGFIIVVLDPRGTPLRSKAFHDVAYGNLQNGCGIDDQVGAIKQLGERYAWMDLDRVGITGFSGGGFASARAMLSHPDFFKVAVSNAGNLDNRFYNAEWAETFQGLLEGDNYEEQACVSLAKNLKGKLLLTHGESDANVHPAHTLQFVNELIKHNKTFDLLILPNRQHGYYEEPYFFRRLWDYFVEHLLREDPPEDYCIRRPS